MQWNSFITGISPGHVPALVAALCLPGALWLGLAFTRARAALGDGWAVDLAQRIDSAGFANRLIAVLLLTTSVIHLALPLGHADSGLLGLMFVASGVAYFRAALAALGTGRWRRWTALLLTANIVAYLVVAGSGWQEEADQVGISTKIIELTALGLVLLSGNASAVAAGRSRIMRATGLGALTLVTGVTIWVGSFAAHAHSDAAAADHDHEPGTPAHGHAAGHSHVFAARAQAGTIIRPRNVAPPTTEQLVAAGNFAADTKAGVARYEDHTAAVADGYALEGPMLGIEVHFANKSYRKDGQVLDPTRPEMLVYAADGDGYLLLGAVYQMPRAGEPGPDIGGPLASWHAHNICFTLLPPGFGLVSPFGTCPIAAAAVTLPEMIHVWTVDNPGGPYAEQLDDKFVRSLVDDK